MSKKKKARRPNVPLYTGPVEQAAPRSASRDVGGGMAGLAPARAAASSPAQINANYTHIANDLKRIGLLAGGFIALLVVLSFFIR
ncbi:MAG: hypothetical protein HY023_03405 [Chloroflexi bacterium]|nr:hypothetical protein [Chloroflexota bacterium]MBI3764528.1 hypothetical protein [Chloroflexota bacterium]